MSRWVNIDELIITKDKTPLIDMATITIDVMVKEGMTKSIEIVRCKECKHYVAEIDSGDGREWSSCEYWLREIDPDDFCSYGERRQR